MSVNIDVDGQLFTVSHDRAMGSEYIKELLVDLGPNEVTVVPQKYYDIAYNYIFFLQGRPLKIYDREVLAACFDMYSYFFDDNYFIFIVEQLLNNWSYLFTVVFEHVNLDIQRQILLHCPHDFLPDAYLKDKVFFKAWMKINVGNSILVNGIEEYKFDISYTNYDASMITYEATHTVNGNTVGRTKKILIRDDGKITTIYNSFDGKMEGMYDEWDRTGNNPLIREERHDNKLVGMFKKWYPIGPNINGKHQLENQGLYVDNKMNGLWRVWYTSGQIAEVSEYVNGQYDGIVTQWYLEGFPSSEGKYVKGKMEGLWKEWYDNKQISRELEYVNGINHGIESIWNYDGSPKSRGLYVRGQKHGLWTYWYEDQNGTSQPYSIIREVGMYENGKQQGEWKYYYDDDDTYFKVKGYNNGKIW